MSGGERYQRACDLVGRLLRLPVEDRDALLELECDGDNELRREAESLLAYSDASTSAENEGCQVQCPATEHPSSPQSGLLVDDVYRLIRRLGDGGQGSVWLAEHTLLNKSFAVKFVHSMPAEQFLEEARLLARFDHPYIVDVTHFGFDETFGTVPYLVTEFVEGESLLELCARRGRLRAENDRDWEIVSMLLEATAHAHSIGIVHGDLSPANIMIESDRQGRYVLKILDFGLARMDNGGGLRAIGGTAAILAPELIKGAEPAVSSDVYAVGVLLYWAFTGIFPFGTLFWDVSARQSRGACVPPSKAGNGVPHELNAPLLGMLALNPEERTASAQQALEALNEARYRFRLRLWRRRQVPGRVAAALAISAGLTMAAPTLQNVSVVSRLERNSWEWRFEHAPTTAPDARVLVALIDDDSLPGSARLQPSMLAAGVERLFQAGARHVALDLVIHSSDWADPRAEFSTLLARYASRMTLGLKSVRGKDRNVSLGDAFLHDARFGSFWRRTLASSRQNPFAFVNVEKEDGFVWRGFTQMRVSGSLLTTGFAAHAAAPIRNLQGIPNPFIIDYTAANRVRSLRWSELMKSGVNGSLKGCIVIVGSNTASDRDEHAIPVEPGVVPGAVLQALIANTIIRGAPVHTASEKSVYSASFLLALAMAAVALLPQRRHIVALVLSAVAAAYLILALIVFQQTRELLPVTGPLLLAVVAAFLCELIAMHLVPRPARKGRSDVSRSS